MGKRKRRLLSPKYAKKYASVRAKYNKLRGVVEAVEADGVITEEETKLIKAAEAEVVEAVKQAVETPVLATEELPVDPPAPAPAPTPKKAKKPKTPPKKSFLKKSAPKKKARTSKQES